MILEIKNLVKRYGDMLAVDNLSLELREGQILGLLGPNGAGKTTTINCILGLISFDGGEIKIFGKRLNENEMEIKRNIGVVPQDVALYGEMTAYENVDFFARLYGLKGRELKSYIEETLNFVGLWEKRKEKVKKFSGGMKRRLNIACGIVHRPKFIIMDEPTVGIDPQSRNHILESIKKLNKDGATIIYTSHYMEEVDMLCDYISIMDKGRIIAKGTSEELKSLISTDTTLIIEISSISHTVIESIKQVNGVIDCFIDEGRLKIISKKSANNLSKIIDCLLSNDVQIISLTSEKPTLEGVFLTLTGRSLRD
ncbi:ABC transporter ATP-binding protein [Caloramator sp. CAR-1]|uniref:ABC transporter ATP-binding protein n=1 Tax=Caloramator sp. CAR-1 TaxID=3062777 RepID=UPI0026E340E8|nr:ABC transporter ATP-binding protein [Caloramator sp. CAR-1]MDO6355509.1 ABC transporter ATP-binding protein [Caloramator sp. CAR-1]